MRCYGDAVNTAEIVARLKAMEPELRSAGLEALYLFGSRARGDERADSDVDLAFDIGAARELRFSLLDQAILNDRLSVALGTAVDFVEHRSLRPRIRAQFDQDAFRVFG